MGQCARMIVVGKIGVFFDIQINRDIDSRHSTAFAVFEHLCGSRIFRYTRNDKLNLIGLAEFGEVLD